MYVREHKAANDNVAQIEQLLNKYKNLSVYFIKNKKIFNDRFSKMTLIPTIFLFTIFIILPLIITFFQRINNHILNILYYAILISFIISYFVILLNNNKDLYDRINKSKFSQIKNCFKIILKLIFVINIISTIIYLCLNIKKMNLNFI